VYALRSFAPGDIIEECPVLIVPASEKPFLVETALADYYFRWDDDAALALGYGSLYNHSYKPNATFELHPKKQVIGIVAWLYIEANEEVTINYNGSPAYREPVWFDQHGDAK
jgi:SET domain-containing protein